MAKRNGTRVMTLGKAPVRIDPSCGCEIRGIPAARPKKKGGACVVVGRRTVRCYTGSTAATDARKHRDRLNRRTRKSGQKARVVQK